MIKIIAMYFGFIMMALSAIVMMYIMLALIYVVYEYYLAKKLEIKSAKDIYDVRYYIKHKKEIKEYIKSKKSI